MVKKTRLKWFLETLTYRSYYHIFSPTKSLEDRSLSNQGKIDNC